MLAVLTLLQLLNVIGNELNYLLLLILSTDANHLLDNIVGIAVITKLYEYLCVCYKITHQLSFSLLAPFG